MKNIWVKYTIRHGGGHHGTTIHYIYFDHDVTHDDLYHQCDMLCRSMNQARAKWKIVKKLPKSVKEKLIKRYNRKIEIALEMRNLIKKTPTLKKDLSEKELRYVR
jgi:hypothetical protein